jgi:hypothetical protein
MVKYISHKRLSKGVSIIEIMIVLVLISIIMGGMFLLFNKTSRQLRSQSMVADIQTVGSIAFFLIGRDIRRAGSNPAGALGYNVGAPIPFGFAEKHRIQIFADLNGDGDVDDDEEDIVYEYVDNEAEIDGDDTVQRTSGSVVTYITNVYNFELQYVMSNGLYTDTPAPFSDIRMVVIKFEVGTEHRDPTTSQIITKSFETTVGLRNYQ